MDRDQRVARVESIMQEWARGNWAAGGELLTDEAVVSWQEPPADLVVCTGPGDVARRLRSFLEQWSEFRVEPLRLAPLASDAVLVHARQVHVGKTSGARIERETWIAFRFDGDRIAQIRWNWDRATALGHAGLDGLLDIVAPLVEGWEAGDFRPPGSVFADDIVLTGFTAGGDDRAHGAAEINAYLRQFFAEWREYRISVERIRGLDDRHVFIEGRQHGIGRTSGIEIDESVFIVVRVEDALVRAVHWHARRDGVFEQAGLEP